MTFTERGRRWRLIIGSPQPLILASQRETEDDGKQQALPKPPCFRRRALTCRSTLSKSMTSNLVKEYHSSGLRITESVMILNITNRYLPLSSTKWNQTITVRDDKEAEHDRSVIFAKAAKTNLACQGRKQRWRRTKSPLPNHLNLSALQSPTTDGRHPCSLSTEILINHDP